MALFEVGDVGLFCLFANGGLPFANGFCYFCHLAGFDEGLGEGLDVFGNRMGVDDAVGHFGFEGAVACKDHKIMEVVFGDAKVVGECADVFVVLA